MKWIFSITCAAIISAASKLRLYSARASANASAERFAYFQLGNALKWAGGKSRLLSEIGKYYPFSAGEITRYAEPFLGGVFFDMAGKCNLREAYLGDINPDLINAYGVVQNAVDDLVEELELLQREYINPESDGRKRYYEDKRNRFNSLKLNHEKNGAVQLIANADIGA